MWWECKWPVVLYLKAPGMSSSFDCLIEFCVWLCAILPNRQVAAMFVRTCVCVQGQLSYQLCSVLIGQEWLPNLVAVCTCCTLCVCLCAGVVLCPGPLVPRLLCSVVVQDRVVCSKPTGGGLRWCDWHTFHVLYDPDAVMSRSPCSQTALFSCCVGPCVSQLLHTPV